jgi:hypothetical protein
VDRENWHTECKGQIWAEVFGLKLIVRQSGTYARYVILRPSGSEGTRDEVMLSSGTEPNVKCCDAGGGKGRDANGPLAARAPQVDGSGKPDGARRPVGDPVGDEAGNG